MAESRRGRRYGTKYTKERLTPVVAASLSVSEVLKRLGVAWSGGMHSHIVSRIKMYGLSTAHFLGQRANSGKRHKGGSRKHASVEILVTREQGRRERTARLRRALIESGVDQKCNACGLGQLWMGKPIVLQINHRDGNRLNNAKENLEFLCPNCHSQTETFGIRNMAG